MRRERGGNAAGATDAGPNVPAFALAALAVAALALRFVDVSALRTIPLCLLHALTGLHCPGCGATRALHALAHGDLALALRMNALFVAALPALAIASLRRVDVARSPRAWLAAAVLAAIFGVARNLPAEPFVHLAPPPSASVARD